MTNPFATFRKNQKVWMAGLVLLAILAFVIAPVFDYAMSAVQGGSSAGQVVVRWDGGQITQTELALSTQKHSEVVRFLQLVAEKVIEKGGKPAVPNFQYDPQSRQIMGIGIQFSSDPVNICRTRFLAAKAEKLGVAFDDEAVDQFLISYVNNKLSDEEVNEMMSKASGGTLTYYEVCQVLKTELSAYVVARASMSGLFAENRNSLTPITTPGKSYRDFAKLNRTAKVEAFPVLVDDYLDKVSGEPSEAELQEIYEQGMTQVASADSAQAGFARRYRANIEYVEASLQKWTDAEKANVTEEEIKAEYDRRVELGQLKVPVEDESAEAGEASEGSDGIPAEGAESGEAETPVSDEPSDAEKATSEDEAVEEEPAAAGEEAPAPAEGDQSLKNVENQAVKLVAYVQEQGNVPPPVVQPPQLESSVGNPTAATNAASDTEPAAQENAEAPQPTDPAPAPSDQAPAPDEDGDGEETTPMAPATDDDAGETAASAVGDESTTPAEPEMRTQTLEEARETIVESLAREKAIPALDEALTTLLDDHMRPYFGKFRQYQAQLEAGMKDVEEPVRPNIKKLAEELNLIYRETGLVDGTAISQSPVGQSNLRAETTGFNGSVANNLMVPNRVDVFAPLQSSYFDQQALMRGEMPEFLQYLLWKTEEQLPYVPELAEVRDEVVDAWKREKARVLAEAAASELSKKVGGENPWDGALNETEKALVVETNNFTWMNRMGDFIIPTPVPKLDRVGNEFMQAVFNAPAGEIVVAANSSKNVYYVTRVVSFEPDEENLQSRFEADPIKAGVNRIVMEERNLHRAAWYEQLENELNVQWQVAFDELY